MKEITIGKNEAGQRLDKLLGKLLNQAPASFIYKMLRKKNIKLNQKRAEGREVLQAGDQVQIYLSDETFHKFHKEKVFAEAPALETPSVGKSREEKQAGTGRKAPLFSGMILYQDDNIMLLNKPAGVLSQKAKLEDDSINEQMLRYLLEQGMLNREQMRTFTPSVCNRLDRNTSGIVLAGISLRGSQELSRMLKERSLEKYYLTLVAGNMTEPVTVRAYLRKDTAANRVTVSEQPIPEGIQIETQYRPLQWNAEYTLLEVKLITGKSHQIRSHLAYLGHPVLGDAKYGNREQNRDFRKRFGIQNQFLHAYRVVFPQITGELESLSQSEWKAPLPGKCKAALELLWGRECVEQL
ncbi:MAG: RluA family pseudouridine synthase [Bacteroides sp.]|nr:RluA family pseudouridine synthase [Bacteroides sp.]MCM1549823.1 RluA family pseudouridine synthase [Clostridium sp.]